MGMQLRVGALAAILLLVGVACSDLVAPPPTATPAAVQAPVAAPSGPRRPEATTPVPRTASDPRGENAMVHVRALAEAIGVRVAASPGERAAAEYVAAQLASSGYQARIEPVRFPTFMDEGSRLAVQGETFDGSAVIYTASGRVRGRLVPSGLGGARDYPPEVAGNIALVERGVITFQEKASAAAAAGAVGLVIYNNQAGPFSGSLREQSRLPVLAVEQAQGRRLVELAGAEAQLEVYAELREETSWNVVADSDPSQATTVILGAHMDSVPGSPGANDNASGTAAVLELARALAGRSYPFNLRFMAFGAEEIGLVGSQAYARGLGDGARSIRAMLNFDMVAVGDRFRVGGDTDLRRRAVSAARELGFVVEEMAGVGGSDHAAFSAVGIPSVFFHVQNDPNYHTPRDTVDKLNVATLEMVMRTAVALLERLR